MLENMNKSKTYTKIDKTSQPMELSYVVKYI